MNSASMVTSDNQKSGAVVPGTNKYTMEGSGDKSINKQNELKKKEVNISLTVFVIIRSQG